MPVQCTCRQCGAAFTRKPREVRRGGGLYCSRPCFQQARPVGQSTTACTCLHCGTTFETLTAYANRGGGLYCSPVCRDTARRNRIACVCALCGAAFEIKVSERKYGRGLHCSKKCQDDARGRLLTTFWDWVDRSDPDGCWPWTRSKNEDGYGLLRVGQKTVRTHRHAWELTYGPIPDGLVICHTCDNPPCCRPDHLALGMQVDNMEDMATKGRAAKKLTAEAVREIRRLRTEGATLIVIAKQFAIDQSMVSQIARRVKWAHIE